MSSVCAKVPRFGVSGVLFHGIALRFADQRELLVSGLLDGGSDVAQRPLVVDVPMEKGHVVLFANNPIWRGETIGSYFLVFNTLLNFDNLNAGRKLDAK